VGDDDDMTADDARDLGLLDELRAIAGRADPVPQAAILAARSAIAWRTMDAELAELTYDSVLDDSVAAVRSGETTRLVTFEAGDAQIEIQVATAGDKRRLVGQVVPTRRGALEVHAGEAVRLETTVDALGRFAVEAVPAGPIRLLFRPDDGGADVRTDWLLV
jgi:hypothetical protein